MATFTPPVADGRRVGDPSDPSWAYFKFLGSWATGKTVWKDSQGVWHESIEPYAGGATTTVHDGNVTTTTAPDEGLATAQKVYLGGHVHTISEADADELVAQGYSMLTRESISESFNKADGALGPLLAWQRKVFAHQFQFQVASNRARLTANAAGSWEDLVVPTPNVDSPNVEFTLDVVDLTRGLGAGAPSYVIDVGAVARGETRSGDTNYRGYAAGIGRNNIFFPPGHTWHLAIFRVDGTEVTSTLLDIAIASLTDVTLPGTFTFTADGPNLSASFTHAGPGPTLTVDAVDSTYKDGFTGLGGSVVIEAGDTGTIDVDNFQAGPP